MIPSPRQRRPAKKGKMAARSSSKESSSSAQQKQKDSKKRKAVNNNNVKSKRSRKNPSTKIISAEVAVSPSSSGDIFPLFDSPSASGDKTFAGGIQTVAGWLRQRRNICVLVGAGISTTCGIPDFRSAKTGLYASLDLEDLGLCSPEELFDWDFFQDNPAPFYQFANNLYFPTGRKRARPSDSHKLLALLEKRKQLRRVYSQNIDGLEQDAGVSAAKIVYAHGSLRWASCLKCKHKVPSTELEANILEGSVPHCQRVKQPGKNKNNNSKSNNSPQKTMESDKSNEGSQSSNCNDAPLVNEPKSTLVSAPPERRQLRKRAGLGRSTSASSYSSFASSSSSNSSGNGDPRVCGGVLKPDVTFFGQPLNDSVSRCLKSDREKVDALIVIGTSLSVAPISKVIGYFPHDIPRILINRTVVHPQCQDLNEEQRQEDQENEQDRRKNRIFDAYLLGNCDDVTRELAKHLFAADDEEPPEMLEAGRLLFNVADEDDKEQKDNLYRASEWESVSVPRERVFLFPGAQPPDAEISGPTFQEVAHCDGCHKEIRRGPIYKCSDCFDYDLCAKCYPRVSQTHHKGTHSFITEKNGAV